MSLMQGELKGKVTNMRTRRSIEAMISEWQGLEEDVAEHYVQALTWVLMKDGQRSPLERDLGVLQTLQRRAARESFWWPVSWHSPIVKTRWDR